MLTGILILLAFALAPPTTVAPGAREDLRAWLREADRCADAAPAGRERDWLLGRLARLHARAGDVEGAVARAAKIDDPQLRIFGLSHAFKGCLSTGDRAGAGRICAAMREFAASPQGRAAYHSTDDDVIDAMLELDDVAGAVRFIQGNGDQWAQEYGFEALAAKLAARGDVEAAVATVERLQDDAWKPRSFIAVVHALAERKRFEEASRVAGRIEPLDMRERATVILVAARAKAGQQDEARRLVSGLTGAEQRERATRSIDEARALALTPPAERRFNTGLIYLAGWFPSDSADVAVLLARRDLAAAEVRIEQAVRRVDGEHREPVVSKFGTFTDASRRAAVRLFYLDLALAQARAGDEDGYRRSIEHARQGAGIMDMAYYRDLMLGEIATAQVAARRWDDAWATAAQIGMSVVRDGPLMQLARAQIQSGDLDAARRTAGAISPQFRGSVRGEILRARLERGDRTSDLLTEANEVVATGDEAGQSVEWVAALLMRRADGATFRGWFDALPSPAMKAHAAAGAAAGLLPDEAPAPPASTRPGEKGEQ